MRKIKETKKKTTKKQVEEETIKLESVIKVFVTILVLFGLFYVLTVFVVDKRNSKKKNDKETKYTNIKEEANDILATDILKQAEEKYYVLIINDNKKDIYNLYTRNISEGLYNVDLNNALNKSIVGQELVVSPDPREIKINDSTLFVVENGVITEYYVGEADIVNQLKTLAF